MGCNSSIQVGLENVNTKPISVVMLGLQNAGKTSIIEYLAGEYNINDPPVNTNGILLRDLSIHNVLYRILDIGGRKPSTEDIQKSIKNSDAVVYVFDQPSFEANLKANQDLISNSSSIVKEKHLPIVVFINKVEANSDNSVEKIENFVQSYFGSDTNKNILKMGKIGDEVFTAFQWIFNNVVQ